jgi:hypothetical protein
MDHVILDERSLAENYLAGLLPPDDRATFEVHLVGCEECRDRLLLAEMFRGRAPRPGQDAAPPRADMPQTPGTRSWNSGSAPSNRTQFPEDTAPSASSQVSDAQTFPAQAGKAPSEAGSKPPPRMAHHLYSGPERRRMEDRGADQPLRPMPWSRRPAPAARDTIAYHAVLQPTPPRRRGRRLALAAGVLFAVCAGYFTGVAVPLLHGSGADAVTAYNVTSPARTRDEALAQIVEQSNVVLGGERITLALIRSTLPLYDHSSGREYQEHAKRLREYHDIFRKEYQSLLLLYKTNESMLQKGDILFLDDAMAGADDVERNMQQLESLNLH